MENYIILCVDDEREALEAMLHELQRTVIAEYAAENSVV